MRVRLMTLAADEIKLTGLQPAHSKHVESRAEGTIPQAVFANPKLPGPVIDRDFHDCEAGVLDERGNETVHALERNEGRSKEHTSEIQSLMRISYAVCSLKKKKTNSRHLDSKSRQNPN